MSNEVTDFAQQLLARGMELTLRNERLRVWPGKSYKQLTDAERAFIDAHRNELKDMVRAGLQPKLPDDFVIAAPDAANHPDFAPPPPAPALVGCVYCGQSPCIGADHPAYRVLHWNDPAEVERRRRDAVAATLRGGQR